MRKYIKSALLMGLAISAVCSSANAATQLTSYDTGRVENNAVLSHLSKSAHEATDTTVYQCTGKIDKGITGEARSEAVKSCQYEGLKALSEFSICAVYNNTQALTDKTTDSCFAYILNKYAK